MTRLIYRLNWTIILFWLALVVGEIILAIGIGTCVAPENAFGAFMIWLGSVIIFDTIVVAFVVPL